MKEFVRRHGLIIQLGVFLVYALVRIGTTLPALQSPRDLADTDIYIRLADESILGAGLLNADRPVGFPLLLLIAGHDFSLAAGIQLALTIFSWGMLAFAVSRSFQSMVVRFFSFAIILALGLARHLAGWDFVMMTESLSLSLFALLIACAAWLLQGWRTIKLIALAGVAVLFAFTRDTNAYLLAMAAGLILIAVMFRWCKPRGMAVSFIFLAIFAASYLTANMGERWVFPFVNVMGRRILPYLDRVEYFEDCGMPVTPELMEMAWYFAGGNDRRFFNDPALEGFRQWLAEDGKACYMKWLVSHPAETFAEVYREFDGLMFFDGVGEYFSRNYSDLLPSRIERLLYPVYFADWILAALMVGAIAASILRPWVKNPLWALFIILSLTIFPHAYITWHGDAMAPERHMLSVGMQLSVSFWLLLFLAGERVGVYFGEGTR
ncbi:MAG: hypothetical protein IPG44_20350 [Anaerolineales bacterium]|jgi:hypothetical protein|nr:hypothetical protein [Anaerolineales bacterium]